MRSPRCNDPGLLAALATAAAFLATAIGLIGAPSSPTALSWGQLPPRGDAGRGHLYRRSACRVGRRGRADQRLLHLPASGRGRRRMRAWQLRQPQGCHRWSHRRADHTIPRRLCRRGFCFHSTFWRPSDDLHHGRADYAVPTHPNGDRVAQPASAMRRHGPARPPRTYRTVGTYRPFTSTANRRQSRLPREVALATAMNAVVLEIVRNHALAVLDGPRPRRFLRNHPPAHPCHRRGNDLEVVSQRVGCLR